MIIVQWYLNIVVLTRRTNHLLCCVVLKWDCLRAVFTLCKSKAVHGWGSLLQNKLKFLKTRKTKFYTTGESPKCSNCEMVSWGEVSGCAPSPDMQDGKSICVDSGLKGRWLCKQNHLLQMCLLNCHMWSWPKWHHVLAGTWNIFKCDPVENGQDSEILCKM